MKGKGMATPTFSSKFTPMDGSFSVLEYLDSMKDSSVTFDSKLKFNHHFNEKVNKSYSVLSLININS